MEPEIPVVRDGHSVSRSQIRKPPQIQVVATNAVTMQPMEGTENVFLIPAAETKEIEDAANFLFEKYSH